MGCRHRYADAAGHSPFRYMPSLFCSDCHALLVRHCTLCCLSCLACHALQTCCLSCLACHALQTCCLSCLACHALLVMHCRRVACHALLVMHCTLCCLSCLACHALHTVLLVMPCLSCIADVLLVMPCTRYGAMLSGCHVLLVMPPAVPRRLVLYMVMAANRSQGLSDEYTAQLDSAPSALSIHLPALSLDGPCDASASRFRSELSAVQKLCLQSRRSALCDTALLYQLYRQL